MIKLHNTEIYFANGKLLTKEEVLKRFSETDINDADKNTISYGVLKSHNVGDENNYKIKFDALTSHDITYVGITQTARASGLDKFPVPYVLTNCHNSLCAVGGTINEDDHIFGLSAAQKYGGIYVPAHLAVIHQYMREMMAGCGKMILGSDSHTRYGAIGTMAIGEGGPELVKQILGKTYDISKPEIIAVVLEGNLRKGVGPQDVSLAIIKAVFKNGFVKNKIMEFVGSGIKNLSMETRCGIDVMTTETTCLSSIWETDSVTEEFLNNVGRGAEYKSLKVEKLTKYAGAIEVDLSAIEPMIAMPFHPSNVYTLSSVIKNPYDILSEVENNAKSEIEGNVKLDLVSKIANGKIYVDQGIIAGCAGGTYENIFEASNILNGKNVGNLAYNLSVYPSSQPVYSQLLKNGAISPLFDAGAIVKTAFCGPCFGAGDVPSNNAFSIRHTTRNFPSREGSKPNNNQIASVALMDARSIAVTSAKKGELSSALDYDYDNSVKKFYFDKTIYENRVFFGYEKGNDKIDLKFGPNIADWPKMINLQKNVLLKACSVILDSVTTTDELIPSGETSSYRSNPLKLAEFTLSRKDPDYVKRAKEANLIEMDRQNNRENIELSDVLKLVLATTDNTCQGSFIFANKPGDGSAREQAASCQRVLGGLANVAVEYATKRYRSNLINWGMLPLIISENCFAVGDYLFIENIYDIIKDGILNFDAKVISNGVVRNIKMAIGELTNDEKDIILSGSLINYYNFKP